MKSFSSFCLGFSPNYLKISRSNFNDILQSSIKLDSLIVNNITYVNRPTVNGSVLSLEECSFIRCKQHLYTHDGMEGGALLLRGVIFSATDCIFRQCFAYQNGGAIRVSSSSSVNIDGCLFAENTATSWCAGVSLFNVFTATIQNCNFTLNKCQNKVSCLMFSLCKKISASKLIFFNNSAKSHGAFWVELSTGESTGLIFVQNSANIASSIVLTNESTFSVKESAFSDLSQDASILVTNDATAEISKCKFAGSEKDEISKVGGGSADVEDCQSGEKTEVTLESLSILPPEVTEAQEEQKYVTMPPVAEPESQTPIPEVIEQPGMDKSTIMLVAYAVVIAILIIGLKMYFSAPPAQEAPNDNSIFGDDDFDTNHHSFMRKGTTEDTTSLKQGSQMLVDPAADVPLEMSS